MLPIIHIGPLAIQFPGLILLLGLWLGLSLAEKFAQNHHVTPNQVYSVSFAALFAAGAAARLVYVIRHISTFVQNPVGIFALKPDLLDPWGAFLGVGLVALYFTRRYKLNPWDLADALAPVLAVMMIAIHLANLASGDGYGAPSNVPWAIFLLGEWRHPTQIYELIASGVVLFYFWPGSRRARFNTAGRLSLSIVAATAGCRLFFEAFHGDSPIISGGLRSTQLTAWLIMALAFWMLSRQSRPAVINNSEQPPSNKNTPG